MKFISHKMFFGLVLSIVLIACQNPQTTIKPSVANNEWDKYVEQFINDYFVTHPEFAAYKGKHEFDDKFSDWSEEGLQKEIARLNSERKKALAFKDEQLDERQRFERDYLIFEIDRESAFYPQSVCIQEGMTVRGTYDPAYLNYTMGKLMIKKLREDWTALRGGRTAWKQFHDSFLSFGGPPIPLVRKAMMGKDNKGLLF